MNPSVCVNILLVLLHLYTSLPFHFLLEYFKANARYIFLNFAIVSITYNTVTTPSNQVLPSKTPCLGSDFPFGFEKGLSFFLSFLF